MRPFTTYLKYSKLKLRKDRELPPTNPGLFNIVEGERPSCSAMERIDCCNATPLDIVSLSVRVKASDERFLTGGLIPLDSCNIG